MLEIGEPQHASGHCPVAAHLCSMRLWHCLCWLKWAAFCSANSKAYSPCLDIARRPLADITALVFPQLFTWASLLVDTIITAVLVYNFHKRKQDNDLPQRSRKLLNGLIRTAFETCAIPWFVVFASSVFGAVAFVHPAYTRPIYWALCGKYLI